MATQRCIDGREHHRAAARSWQRADDYVVRSEWCSGDGGEMAHGDGNNEVAVERKLAVPSRGGWRGISRVGFYGRWSGNARRWAAAAGQWSAVARQLGQQVAAHDGAKKMFLVLRTCFSILQYSSISIFFPPYGYYVWSLKRQTYIIVDRLLNPI